LLTTSFDWGHLTQDRNGQNALSPIEPEADDVQPASIPRMSSLKRHQETVTATRRLKYQLKMREKPIDEISSSSTASCARTI